MTEYLERVPEEVLGNLPLFPLPNVVLFPGMLVPLQVFEPRYLALVEHCISADGIFAIPLLKPGFEDGYEGRPPVHELIGAGLISGHRTMEDGTMTVVVRGIERLRLIEERPPDHSFRLARTERVAEAGRDLEFGEEMVVLGNLLSQLGQALPQAGLVVSQIEEVAEDTPELIDLLAAYVVGDVALRQELLAELNVPMRFARLAQIIADIVLQSSSDEVLH